MQFHNTLALRSNTLPRRAGERAGVLLNHPALRAWALRVRTSSPAADATSNVAAGHEYILHQSPTGPSVEYDQIASMGVFLSAACQSVGNAERLAAGKFSTTQARIRQSVAARRCTAAEDQGRAGLFRS